MIRKGAKMSGQSSHRSIDLLIVLPCNIQVYIAKLRVLPLVFKEL